MQCNKLSRKRNKVCSYLTTLLSYSSPVVILRPAHQFQHDHFISTALKSVSSTIVVVNRHEYVHWKTPSFLASHSSQLIIVAAVHSAARMDLLPLHHSHHSSASPSPTSSASSTTKHHYSPLQPAPQTSPQSSLRNLPPCGGLPAAVLKSLAC